MTDSERIARLEHICGAQQAVIDHQIQVVNRLLKATGVQVGTHMLSSTHMNAIRDAQRM